MRTRFPPSPTGLLHIGGLRTALYCWLLARQSQGTFILRIEDTDQEREVEGAVENILETLAWARLDPDEGVMLEAGKVVQRGECGPYIQSQRLAIYREHAERLVASGHAYEAFDTPEEIDRMREEEKRAGNPAPKYDLTTRMRMRNALTLPREDVAKRRAAGEAYVLRLKVPENVTITCEDRIRGTVSVHSRDIDDAVLLKSDGFPTYHLANVVDDHLMAIDLVLRGEEWLPSLPKHVLLYRAFGWEMPLFAHVPLLLNKDRTKLSKRQNDVAASEYIAKGYLPEALLNFVALLGWNPGTTQEILSLEEMIEQFSLERIQKGGAIFDLEKLDWLQGQWMRRLSPEEFASRIRPLVTAKYPEAASDEAFGAKAALIRDRITFFSEAPEMLGYFYAEPSIAQELLVNTKQKVTADFLPSILTALIAALEGIPAEQWSEESLKTAITELTEAHGWKLGQILWPLRAAVTGRAYSPGAFEVAAAVGRGATLRRLSLAQAALGGRP